MATMTNKQQVINQVSTLLGKHYKRTAEFEKRPILEHLLYAICREGTTRERADKAYEHLKTQFFDWNEIRVSSVQEISEAISAIPNAGERAEWIVGILQYWFELKFNYDMEELAKKGLKEAGRQLSRMFADLAKEKGWPADRWAGFEDYVVAWVMQQGLGGHAVPLDEPELRVLRRLGAVEGEIENPEEVRSSIEHHVPKTKGATFVDLLSTLAAELCTEESPHCTACPLRGECPTGQEIIATMPEPKPRKSR